MAFIVAYGMIAICFRHACYSTKQSHELGANHGQPYFLVDYHSGGVGGAIIYQHVENRSAQDRKSTRLNSSHTVIYTLSLHALFRSHELGANHGQPYFLVDYHSGGVGGAIIYQHVENRSAQGAGTVPRHRRRSGGI